MEESMERPQIKHIAIAVPDGQREKLAEYYKTVFRMEEKDRSPNGGIYLSDGHICLALINTRSQGPGLNHFGFQVGSIPQIEEASHSTAQDNVPGARAEKWIRDPEGNRVDISEDGWPI
jgi:catechol 2,3-dioxygenase-like lactoylglutathione lyase family enzyme